MGVSTVLDPTTFNEAYFNKAYQIHARNLLDGIEKDGLLIIDSENELRDAIFKQIESLRTKYRQQLQIRFEELFKAKKDQVVECCILSNNASLRNLLDLAYYLRTVSEADTLIVGSENLETLKANREYSEGIVLLSEYHESNFGKSYQEYHGRLESIETLPKLEIGDTIIHSEQFNDWLASIVDTEIFASRQKLITLLEQNNSHEALAQEFREFFNGYYALALELEECEGPVLTLIEKSDALAHLKHRVSAVEMQRKSSPLGREARRMGMSIHSDPMPEVKVAALSLDGFQTLIRTLGNWRLFVSRNRLVKLMETEEPIEIIDRLRIEFYEFFVCYLELELFLENYDYDPDEGLELRPEFIEELEREGEYIKSGGKMFTLEEVAKELGLNLHV